MADNERRIVQIGMDLNLGTATFAMKSVSDKDDLPRARTGSIAFVPSTGEYFIMFDKWEGPF